METRNLEDDVLGLWTVLWNRGMIGSVKRTEKSGKEKTKYFLNDYGRQVFALMLARYKIVGLSEISELEQENNTGKVFIICRFCGGKTEQGIAKCQKCGADL